MKKLVVIGMALVMASCGNKEEKVASATPAATTSLGKSINSDAFNQSFKQLLDQYYSLKDNFVAEKDPAIDSAAKTLLVLADSLSLEGLGGDSTVKATAVTYKMGIAAELKGLLGEKDREEKRKAFQMASEQLYDFIRTVQYDREVVYHQFCPMAFNDQGATWLSNSSDIKNPYLPKKMLHCGEVKDSIDLRLKK
jgi:Cu(I)/Ag(I) efflux system membrane fusion protein